MSPLLAYCVSKQEDTIELIRSMVECESPSGDPGALKRFADLLASKLRGAAEVSLFPGNHLRAEFHLPGDQKHGEVLILGHSDTVWPLGTLAQMPFHVEQGRLWGPGVLDMKSGIALFLTAMQALRALNIPVRRRVLLQVNADEETGSASSRALTEEAARASAAVLVLEPGQGLKGKVKTARKGVGAYKIQVHGRASHAGVDFQAGASAILELAKQTQRIAAFTDTKRGISVNPGVIRGGTRSNVVAAEAELELDVRVWRASDAARLDRKLRSLRCIDKRCRIEIGGGLNRPPMERSTGTKKLFGTAKALAKSIGVKLEESSTGGGSDGNFTAALGIPTLDGLGAVGEGAHAVHESVLIDRLADRAALLALLTAEL